jgi:transcription elongation GreA/GreB family factor
MSRAFVKDDDGGEGTEDLPDRLISPHRNLVTPEGLAQIEAEVERLGAAYAEAQTAADRNALQKIARDLRYWTARRSSAEEVMAAPAGHKDVQFGSRVRILRADGRRQTFQIVGEDEAEPAKGTLSYVAPLAQAMMGKSVGDEIHAGGVMAEIESIA